jgi:hypothetical protein
VEEEDGREDRVSGMGCNLNKTKSSCASRTYVLTE